MFHLTGCKAWLQASIPFVLISFRLTFHGPEKGHWRGDCALRDPIQECLSD